MGHGEIGLELPRFDELQQPRQVVRSAIAPSLAPSDVPMQQGGPQVPDLRFLGEELLRLELPDLLGRHLGASLVGFRIH
jgi:hypothetical protein